MRLEKIVLNGFKSFADKTEFTFDSPITAIVGPNGCGKSNIVDAVKWVLGEQSVKSLRSGHMADVIFSGSSSRKAVGVAEVSLFISNTMGELPIEADSVQITRRIYKSNESEYRINNKLCRLKDIRELFLDTGIGVKAYSIIEQGQVEQLLTSSKVDRRSIFEEAAGISKYKAHKKEALRKLERTDQNLLRLADILGEVQKRLRSVKLAAGKARNYIEHNKKLKELQVNYSLVEYHKNSSDYSSKKGKLGKIEERFASVAADLGKNDALISNLGHEIIDTENAINTADNSLVSVQSKIEQQLQRIEFLQSRMTELGQRKESAVEQIRNLQKQRREFEADLEQYRSDIQSNDALLRERGEETEKFEKQIQEINSECISLETQLEDEKSGIIDIVRRTAQLHNELQSITVYRNNLSGQKDRLTGRVNVTRAELETQLTDKAQYKVRLDDIEKVLSELTENLEAKRKKEEELGELIETDNKRLAHSKEIRSAVSSELSILTDMETRREGLNNAVKSILKESSSESGKHNYVEGVLADIIKSEVEYANAVEAALEGQTSALIVNSTNRLLGDRDLIEKLDGRVNFISTDKIEPFSDSNDLSQHSSVIGRVVEFINCDSKYSPLAWKLLGKTLVVDSIQQAMELSKKFRGEYRFVTLKGELLSSDGEIKLGPLGKTAGLISRKSRQHQLQETLETITSEIAVDENQIQQNTQSKEHVTKLCKDLRTAIYEANTEKMQVGSKFSVIEQNITRLKKEEPLISGEIELLEEQIAQSVQKEYDSKQKLDELETVNSERNTKIKELETRYSQVKEAQQSKTNELTELKISLGQAAEQSKALKQTISSLETQLQANLATIETAEAETQKCTEQSQEAQRDILKSESMVSELYVEKEESQKQSRMLHDKVEKLLTQQRETEQLVRQKRGEKDEVDHQINELRIELGQLEVKNQNLIERVQEELQIDLVQSYESYTDSDIDWESVRDEINELRSKIERLGNVNLDAIDEQEELEKRNEFLGSQVEDLNKSKNQLQQLINRLNKQSREKFEQTFEEIRINFQEIFRKLFGGGKADILLEDSEDILEAGIEIMARPPGKETMSISLLSGGEKTMTAIALLFSVFKSKPSPFCLLDEVDAALDEANNERFNLLIREFEKESQFIIITHSKRTMSIADILYGVTMQTRGVSKKISVRFEQIDDQELVEPEAEAAAVA
ncbi:MAG: chromosome segregation protein SMC [Planctomycetes bacterium]|nr:chromosome segregation protein SMC [Planctomycetota bacterium]